ncbi:phosphonate metabolism transcriptional regulator PhnF [Falsiroseomonas sp. HC035]|uniref:phosphonate metabolism transcriptional regulator PhnF n=1 Tax=Falsiroseomonas sp. HC035 TaxID=3390999 RepID=UPI003D312DD9
MTSSLGKLSLAKPDLQPDAKALSAQPSSSNLNLTRRGGVALWRQVMEHVNKDIVKGIFLPGAQLPTELIMARRFGVNRHTVRRAMEELEKLGLINVRQGSGSFVVEDLLDIDIGRYVSLSDGITRLGRKPIWQILRIREAMADQAIANHLMIGRARSILIVERLLAADGFPLIASTHYFPASRFEKMGGLLRSNPSISAALAALGVVGIQRGVTRITARLPVQLEAERLQQHRYRPLLNVESVFMDSAGAVVEFAVATFAPGRTRLVVGQQPYQP